MKVSVLLTCYNHVDFLRAAWDGIQTQTYRDLEIIALDDGSTDGTRELLSSLAATSELPCRVVLNEENLGTYGTLNRGLELAEGELIAVLNDDDVWLPNKLERQIQILQEHPEVGLVHTHGRFIDGRGEVFEGSPLGFTFPKTRTGDVLLDLVYANKIIASAAVFRRDAAGQFNAAYFGSGDWEMWFRIALKWKIGFVDEQLTLYRVHGANASHKLDRIWRDDQMLREWMLPLLEGLEERFPAGDILKAKAHNWACLGTVRTLNGEPKAGRQAYSESLRLSPGRWKTYLRWIATYLPRSAFRALK